MKKRNIIRRLIEIYDTKAAVDVQEVLKALLSRTIQSILKTELEV